MLLRRIKPGVLAPLLLAALLALVGVVVSPGGDGSIVRSAHAADSVSVVVDVVRGTKGASGSDQRANKHRGVLARVPGYGGWKFLDAMKFTLQLGKGAAASGSVFAGTLVQRFSLTTAWRLKVVTQPALSGWPRQRYLGGSAWMPAPGRQCSTTLSRGLTYLTPGPISSTLPNPSWPSKWGR